MQRFRQTIGTHLSPEQADVLALALALAQDEGASISLTDIRGLGIGTTLQAKQVAEHLVRQQLLDAVSDTQFQVPQALRQRFVQMTEQVTDQVGTKSPIKSGPSRDQVGAKWGLSAEQAELMRKMDAEHSIAMLMSWVARSNRSKFREVVLSPLLKLGLLEMTVPDKPSSSKQRYRLTPEGKARLEEEGQ
jgi:ATP-dependent DNA helicase RecG